MSRQDASAEEEERAEEAAERGALLNIDVCLASKTSLKSLNERTPYTFVNYYVMFVDLLTHCGRRKDI